MVALSTTEIIEPAYIEMKHSYKRYQVGDTEIVANRDVNFEIEKGGSWLLSLVHLVQASQRFLISLGEWIPMMRGRFGLMVPISPTTIPTNEQTIVEMMWALFFSFTI